MSGPAGNVYDKYRARNPLAAGLVRGFLAALEDLVVASGAREAHEVGCGEGELALRLARMGLAVRGSDASGAVIAEARRRARVAGIEVAYRAAPIEALERERDGAELIVCCEVLEHVADPELALARIARLARPWAILSVPREPLWRILNLARMSYLRAGGNTPGHVNHWSRAAFLELAAGHMEIVRVRTPIPWTMALCRARAEGGN